MSQAEAAERVAPFLGDQWSTKVWSAAERSVAGGRIRQFSADDIVALARGLGVSSSSLFVVPEGVDSVGAEGGSSMTVGELDAVCRPHAPTGGQIDLLTEAELCEMRAELVEDGQPDPLETSMSAFATSIGGAFGRPTGTAARVLTLRARARALRKEAERRRRGE